MKLFLASRAVHPESLEKLEDYLGGFRGKRIAYIPTAANVDEGGFGSWRKKASWQAVRDLPADVSPIQLEDIRDTPLPKLFHNLDIIWFAGGYAGYLMYWIRRTKLDKYLKTLFEKGTLYVGSSAGSMIVAKTLDIVEWEGDGETGASCIPGLGLVNFDFYPHFEESQLALIKKHYKDGKMYLVKDGEAIVVEDKKVMVLGEERIVKG